VLTRGLVFDIKEFAIHDGPGIRTTVFLKGCPLRCSWCHNPEGISPHPQTMRSPIGERTVGTWYTPEALAGILNGQADILRDAGGGVTFSGGEPLLQAAFVAETIDRLEDVHVVLDTSGCASEGAFRRVATRCDLVYYDLKIVAPDLHVQHTGRGNAPILRNLHVLGTLGVPYVIRVPLIPGVTDTDRNLADIAALVRRAPGLVRVDLLPYNQAAGGKYDAAGMAFAPTFDADRPVNINLSAFEREGLAVRVV
jgi:pyruvate formate lyase activating enzyme